MKEHFSVNADDKESNDDMVNNFFFNMFVIYSHTDGFKCFVLLYLITTM